MKNINKRKKVTLVKIAVVLLVLIIAVRFLDCYGSKDGEPEMPRYEMVSIETLFDTEQISEESLDDIEIEQLFLQTGLGKEAIYKLCRESSDSSEIIKELKEYQKQLFSGCEQAKMVSLEDGDVLVSMSQRFCYYPHGHAAIVIDGEENLMLEAKSYKAGSCVGSTNKWSKLSSFVVLRVKDEIIEQLIKEGKGNPAQNSAIYAKENLDGLKYSLIKEIRPFSESTPEYTQCAHLVWYAYYASGLDIDENRGLIIKPKDFLVSDVFEIVQVYGISPDRLVRERSE